MTGSLRAPSSAIGMTLTERGGIGNPRNADGDDSPDSVAKLSWAIATSSYGFVRISVSTLPSTVNPSARYHVSDVSFEHGATESPAGWMRPLLDDAAAAVEFDDDAGERRRHQRVDVDRRLRPRRDGEVLRRRRTVGGEHGEPSDEVVAVTVRHDDLAADALLAGRRHTGTEPAARSAWRRC